MFFFSFVFVLLFCLLGCTDAAGSASAAEDAQTFNKAGSKYTSHCKQAARLGGETDEMEEGLQRKEQKTNSGGKRDY